MDKTFSEGVFECVLRIPRGKVASYGQIARLIGRPRAARQVGMSISRAPGGLPCHRVVGSSGTLAPADVFGPGVQRAMLIGEGIVFTEGGVVDMKACLCKDDELK